MDLKIQAKAAEHIYRIATKKPELAEIAFKPVKGRFPRENVTVEAPLPRCSPEAVGVNSRLITAFLTELERDKSLNVHQVMVVKDGHVISEAAFAPYRLNMWHVSHSACKTVTALAIGLLITEGKLKLTDKIVKIFDDECPALSKIKLNKLTVEHLLTMTSGIAMNELVAIERDWLRAFFESSCKFEPGTKFHYNSLNSYVLSCIVQKITGATLFEFAEKRIFAPLGIKTVTWESCPMGRTKGGWGMYILPEDMAKLGLFIMNGTKVGGKPIISPDYMKLMTGKRIPTEDARLYGYGYQLWMGKQPGSYFFNGMLGQNICCMPSTKTVVITTGGSNRFFGNGDLNDLIDRYFSADYTTKFPPTPGNGELKELRAKERSCENKVYSLSSGRLSDKFKGLAAKLDSSLMPKEAKAIKGKSYKLERNFIRLQPLFSQLMNNSYSAGIDRISFDTEKNRLVLSVHEGKQINRIPLAFGTWVYTTLNINGEFYEAAVTAGFTADEDDCPVLKIMLPFIEHSDGRIIKIHFLPEGRIRLRFAEYPGGAVLGDGLDFALDGISETLANTISSKVDMDLVADLVNSAFEPSVYGKLM